MADETLTAREALDALLRAVGERDDALRDVIARAMDASKVVRGKVAKRGRKRIKEPSRRVALSEPEAINAAVRALRAVFLELPAVFRAIDSEMHKHGAADRRGVADSLPGAWGGAA
jgi:hypothetical protein